MLIAEKMNISIAESNNFEELQYVVVTDIK